MYSNFRVEKVLIDPNIPLRLRDNRLFHLIIAKVDQTTGKLWWKKTKTITVFSTTGGVGSWKDIETNKYTEGFEIEGLFLSYQLKNNLDTFITIG